MLNDNRKVLVEELKEMFISEGENYTDVEVTMIHDFFYQLIHIEIEAIKQLTEEYCFENRRLFKERETE